MLELVNPFRAKKGFYRSAVPCPPLGGQTAELFKNKSTLTVTEKKGIEPLYSDLESNILPLNYSSFFGVEHKKG